MELGPVIAIACTALAAFVALYWIVVVVVVARLLPKLPRVGEGLRLTPPAEWPSVSIVVPAHNEERVIEECVRTLLASDYQRLEVITVLDRCTDRTRELLRPFEAADPRLTVIENGSCPPDWAGKCNAARVGAERASGRFLLFTDADVQFAPTLVRASMALLLRDGRGLLSILPTLTTGHWFERVVQPAAAMALLRIYPVDRVNRDHRRRPFANGQFMLFDREVYERIGGHAAVKDDLLEDIAFARAVEAVGSRGFIAIADGMMVVSMYPTLGAMRTGWKRIFVEACKRKTSRLRQQAVRIAAIGVLGPIVQVVALAVGLSLGGPYAGAALLAVGIGALAQVVALAAVYRLSRSPISGAFGYPLASAIVAKAFWDGAADLRSGRPIRWGGREYVLTPRR